MALIGTLAQAAVVLAGLTAIGLPAPMGSSTSDSFAAHAWDAIASSGSTSVTVGSGLHSSVTTTTGSEPLAAAVPLLKGGGPLANGLLMSLVLISSLGLMMGRTLFNVARLSSGP